MAIKLIPTQLFPDTKRLENQPVEIRRWCQDLIRILDGLMITIPTYEGSGGGTGETDHSLLTNLEYANAAHEGFEPTVTKGNLTGTGRITATPTRQVIGGATEISFDGDGLAEGTTVEKWVRPLYPISAEYYPLIYPLIGQSGAIGHPEYAVDDDEANYATINDHGDWVMYALPSPMNFNTIKIKSTGTPEFPTVTPYWTISVGYYNQTTMAVQYTTIAIGLHSTSQDWVEYDVTTAMAGIVADRIKIIETNDGPASCCLYGVMVKSKFIT